MAVLRLALLTALILGGCEEDNPPGEAADGLSDGLSDGADGGGLGGSGGSGGGDPGPGRCAQDDHCPPRQRCDDGLCASAQGCVSDLQCGPASACVDGACAFRGDCIRDEQCGPAHVCHDFRCVAVSECGAAGCPDEHVCRDGLCLPTYECLQDVDCDRGMACVERECRPAGDCFGRPACADGQRCDEFSGRCVDAVGCAGPGGASLCPQGAVCVGGVCREQTGCAADTDCDEGIVCDAGVCLPGAECWDEADCGARSRCDGGVCQPVQCDADGDCRAGARCVQGWCLGSDFCDGPEDCPPGRPVCEGGACRGEVGCASDDECEAGVCHDGGCVALPDPDDGCRRDADCDAGTICEVGECVRGCAEAADCPDGRICQGGRCRQPAPCEEHAQCGGGQVCRDGRCAPARDGDPDPDPDPNPDPDPPDIDVEPCSELGLIEAEGERTVAGDTTGAERGWGERGPAHVYTFGLLEPASVELLLQSDPGWNTYLYRLRGPCDDPEEVSANDDLEWRRSSFIPSGPLPPGLYQVVVTGARAEDAGAYTLTARFSPVPANDRCVDAEPVGEGGVIRGTTRGAGAEDGRGPDVWYRIDLERPTAIEALMRTDPAWNTYLKLYAGGCPAADRELVAENDDLEWRRSSFIPSGPLEAGTYHLVATGARPLDYGEFELEVELLEVPGGDGCASAEELQPDGPQVVEGTTQGASADWPGRDSPATWYRFVLDGPKSVDLLIDSTAGGGPAWDTYLALLRGPCDGLEVVAENDDLDWRRSSHIPSGPLDPGVYHVVATGARPLDFGAYTLTAHFTDVPDGDRCFAPEKLVAEGRQEIRASTLGALGVMGRGPDLWYRFTLDAPRAVNVLMDSTGGGGPAWDTYLWLTRQGCNPPVVIRENDDLDWRRTSFIASGPLDAGVYSIVAGGARARDYGEFQLDVEFLEVPAHDRCRSAEPLEATPGTRRAQGLTTGAGADWERNRGPDVWYRIDPPDPDVDPEAEAVSVSLHMDSRAGGTPAWDTYLHLLQGECDALAPVAANDDIEWRATSGVLSPPLEPGAPYYVVASGARPLDFGRFELAATFHPVPANDRCADAQRLDISGPGGDDADATVGTTAGAGWEHELARNRGPDVWYRFTLEAPAALDALLDSGDPSWNTYLYLLRGECGDTEPVAEDDDEQWQRSSRIEVGRLPAGDYLLVASGTRRRDFGRFTLTVTATGP